MTWSCYLPEVVFQMKEPKQELLRKNRPKQEQQRKAWKSQMKAVSGQTLRHLTRHWMFRRPTVMMPLGSKPLATHQSKCQTTDDCSRRSYHLAQTKTPSTLFDPPLAPPLVEH
jgi:hypothetical protein